MYFITRITVAYEQLFYFEMICSQAPYCGSLLGRYRGMHTVACWEQATKIVFVVKSVRFSQPVYFALKKRPYFPKSLGKC